jgi:thioesterase domain-containing protein/acyl carrier protein
MLASIWSEVLKVERVGINDNFFELGGHSLIAVKLVDACNRTLATELSIRALFDHPTVAELAAAVGEGCTGGAFRTLVSLRTAGSRLPVFCIHASGGSAFGYVELANNLGPDQPVYALHATGLAPGESMAISVEEMAAAYVSAIRTVQPHGPYQLLGWSMGGLIAYEMANQLRQLDEEIHLLALIDTLIPAAAAPSTITDAELIAILLEEGIREMPELGKRQRQNSIEAGFAASELNTKARTVPTIAELACELRGTDFFPANIGIETVERIIAVFLNNLKIARRYRHQVPQLVERHLPPISRLVLVRQSHPELKNDHFSWSKIPHIKQHSFEVDCVHSDMLKSPNAKTIAEGIETHLYGGCDSSIVRISSQ